MSLPKTAKAAILVEQNKPLVVDEITLPDSLKCGQVLVRVFYSGICGSQLGEIAGVKGPDKYLPHLLGHEGSGEVIAVGEGVSHVKPGDNVVLHWRPAPGIAAPPPKYKWKGADLNAGWVTTFNEYAIVSENRVTTIPDDFDLRLAPLLGCAVTTGFGAVTNNAKVKIGEQLLVIGAGGIGLNVIQAAAMAGAYPVIAADLHDSRLELASQLGATHVINSAKSDLKESVLKICGNEGLDVVVDNTGASKIIELAHELTNSTGRTILIGVPRKGDNISFYSLPLHFGKTITGSHGGESKPEIDIPRYIKLVKAGRLDLESLLTDTYSLDDINDALDGMRSGSVAGRVLIDLNQL